ncbi:carboxymuconolactone decarboxylase family protein [Streptomyces actuosus]|uniref:Carboxymuconolactone decarboxylase family protein n=1 Tax=Streptomyces actuosus TaxID=1885 RepID=A0ABS2VZ87_STRAS|nr:carboxymuconolactone decarboxylase family protein [Streptomyces actuosus]MBN0048461.1 carboxymuconolactone decarboxylase family protein [Streptomyces actuosus]
MAEDTTGPGAADAAGTTSSPVFDTLVQMTLDVFERSGLDPETYLLTRVAALVALGASPTSYLVNVGTAGEIGVPLEKIQGTLVAVAPVVGTARVVSAARGIDEAFGTALLPEGGEEAGPAL